MKKKLGQIDIKNTKTNKESKMVIWGTLFKTGKGSLYGGVYFTLSPEQIDYFFPFVKQVLERCSAFKMSYKSEFYGEYYQIGGFGHTKYADFDDMIFSIKSIRNMTIKDYELTVNLNKSFQYVIDANIVDKI